jgi:hypothetical protein
MINPLNLPLINENIQIEPEVYSPTEISVIVPPVVEKDTMNYIATDLNMNKTIS